MTSKRTSTEPRIAAAFKIWVPSRGRQDCLKVQHAAKNFVFIRFILFVCTTALLGKERNVTNWIFRARKDFIAAPALVWMGSVEIFEEGYFEVKRHHEQPDEQRAQNDGSLQDLGSESAQAGFP